MVPRVHKGNFRLAYSLQAANLKAVVNCDDFPSFLLTSLPWFGAWQTLLSLAFPGLRLLPGAKMASKQLTAKLRKASPERLWHSCKGSVVAEEGLSYGEPPSLSSEIQHGFANDSW